MLESGNSRWRVAFILLLSRKAIKCYDFVSVLFWLELEHWLELKNQ